MFTLHTVSSLGGETIKHIEHTHCLLKVSRSTVPNLRILSDGGGLGVVRVEWPYCLGNDLWRLGDRAVE